MKFRRILLAWLWFVAAFVAGCGGDGGISGTGSSGELHMSLADAPSCGFDTVNISVEKVRVHQSANAGANDAGWSEIVLAPTMRVNLLSLTNGVLAELGQTQLPAGKYTQLRLVLAPNDAAHPLANSVKPSGGSEVALTTPSAQQSGIKANVNIDVAANQRADFVIDFDACKSVVTAGNSDDYLLKPVIHVMPHFVSGVSGFVNPLLLGPLTAISLQQAGVAVKSTVADLSGAFLLQPVAPGSYDLVITAPGHATAVVTGVVVASDTVSAVNTAAGAINPPLSGIGGTLLGTVTTGAAPIDATVGVQQDLTSGTTITVADAPVNALTGAYTFAVATGAPLVAPFVALPAPLVFAPDGAAAGRFTLRATSNDAVKTAGPFTLGTGASLTTNFIFP